MKFQSTHGSAVLLSEGKLLATRTDASFCNGIVFSDQPIKTGQKIGLELGCTFQWSGALRLGFTQHDPSKLGVHDLPKYSFPHLAKKDGYWIRPISENLTETGCQLLIYLSGEGDGQLFVNNVHKGVLFSGLPVDRPLWLVVDIYGNTKSVRLVKPDDAPREIQARGREAIKAYNSACKSGMRPVYKTRLMLVGKDAAGKTSLKWAMLGLRPDNDQPVSGIDMSTSCTFSLGAGGSWTQLDKDTVSGQENDQWQQAKPTGGSQLEEEYQTALATNIVHELQIQRPGHRKPSSSQKSKGGSRESQRSSGPGGKRLSSKPSSATITKFSDVPVEFLKEVPDKVVEMVQKMLDSNNPEMKNQDLPAPTTAKPHEGALMHLNVWDFAGEEVPSSSHKFFWSSRAVYMFVFNLTNDLQPDCDSTQEQGMSTLDHMDSWLRSIYLHTSSSAREPANTHFSPPIIIVGTHRASLDPDVDTCSKMVEEKFAQIQEFVIGKPYTQHLVTPFFAVDSNLDDEKLQEVRSKVEDVLCRESYIGEKMPTKWLRWEQEINQLTSSGITHASYDQMVEIAGNVGISDHTEVMTMLEFYHDLGTIVFYGSGTSLLDNVLRNTVILQPQWLVDMFHQVISAREPANDKWSLVPDKWAQLCETGTLEESLMDTIWAGTQKLLLTSLLQKCDLICPCLTLNLESQFEFNENKTFFVPSRFKKIPDPMSLYTKKAEDVCFYINFNGLLPDGLFHCMVTRSVSWSQDQSGQRPHQLYRTCVRLYLDTQHDFILMMTPYSRIKVIVQRVSEAYSEEENEEEELSKIPDPLACAKIRNFLESSLCDIREVWIRRLSYVVSVPCPCDRVCETHKTEGCTQESCLHFLNLDHCLANKVVLCEYRRVKTAFIKKSFPEPVPLGFSGPVLPHISLSESCGNIEKHCPNLPSWVKSAAKLLNTGTPGHDWTTLAKELGYKQNQINRFTDDVNPGLVLLADWILSSGNTGLAVDTLMIYLEKLECEDIVDMINSTLENEQEPAQVFVSYQWDSQDEVKQLRDRLERSGFTCWMDIGQVGGGDHLYAKIDAALRHCKVVLACVSPKYMISSQCLKEISLADLLRKPIIPIMLQTTPWPPHGAMALIFSPLVYVSMHGVGGHGGTGLHADKNDRYREILQRVSQHAAPDPARKQTTDTESLKSQDGQHDLSSLSTVTDQGQRSPNSSLELATPSYFINHEASNVPNPSSYRPVEQVHVHVQGCRVCTIL